MIPRKLGKTGLSISPLGYGAAGMGSDRAEAARLLNAVLDTGITVIDTAECYTHSEADIGAAIGHRRSQFAIFTKFGHSESEDPKLPFADWDPRMIAPSLERSLKRLRTDRVDLLQIHSPPHERLIDGSFIEPMKAMKKAGKCRFIGFSGDSESARWAVRSGHFDVLQCSISIADQEAVAFAAEAEAKGMGVLAKRPVANAHWASTPTSAPGDFRDYRRRLQALAYPFLKSPNPGATALRFTLSVPGVATALVHTNTIERLRENAATASLGPLPPSEYQAIRERWQQVAQPDWVGRIWDGQP
jgi:aryl-alcohol dehydrogenase-like predicted oxidoreductase